MSAQLGSVANTPALSVVLVNWNSRHDLENCLGTLVEHTKLTRLELIVVDNASADGSQEFVRRRFPDVHLIENATNVGFARACNQGMAASTGDFILLLNTDTYVCDDVLGRAVRELACRPEIGMLGCELSYPDGRRQHSANRALGIRQSLLERLWLYRLLPRARRAEILLGGYYEGQNAVEADWLAGAFMLLRRELFERSGGFDPRFFMYGEDSEWCLRLRSLGYRILYAPEIGVVFHRGAASSESLWSERERVRRCYVGGLGAYEALHGHQRMLLFRWAELFGSTVRYVAYRLAAIARRDSYYREQARFYGWLCGFYLRPSSRE